MQKIYLLRIMKHTHKYLIFAIFIFLVSLLTLGCQEKEEKKVVLIHSFEQKKDTYPIFNEVLERTFNKQKINPKIHTFYLDCEQYLDSAEIARMYNYIDSIKEIKPDIILVNDDQACYSLLACGHPYLERNTDCFRRRKLSELVAFKEVPQSYRTTRQTRLHQEYRIYT